MKTITVQIGNSEDKLTQSQWSNYCKDVYMAIAYGTENGISDIHFSGTSSGDEKWQNACWVFNCEDTQEIRTRLSHIAKIYKQDSIAWTDGETEFI